MSKVTGKLQVTLPKAITDLFGIHPGDEIDWDLVCFVAHSMEHPVRGAEMSTHRIRFPDDSGGHSEGSRTSGIPRDGEGAAV